MNGGIERLIIYVLTGILWSMFATRMQLKLHPNASKQNNTICTIANFLLWPFCMAIAIVKCDIEVDKDSSSASSESSESEESE